MCFNFVVFFLMDLSLMGFDGNLQGGSKSAELNGLDLIFLKTCFCIYLHREHFQQWCNFVLLAVGLILAVIADLI